MAPPGDTVDAFMRSSLEARSVVHEMRRRGFVLAALALLLVGCDRATPVPTATPSSTPMPATATAAVPSPTPSPKSIGTPTPTPASRPALPVTPEVDLATMQSRAIRGPWSTLLYGLTEGRTLAYEPRASASVPGAWVLHDHGGFTIAEVVRDPGWVFPPGSGARPLISEISAGAMTVFELEEATGRRVPVVSVELPPALPTDRASYWVSATDGWVAIDRRCISSTSFVRLYERRSGRLYEVSASPGLYGWQLVGPDLIDTGTHYDLRYVYNLRTGMYEHVFPGTADPTAVSSDLRWASYSASPGRNGCGDD